MAAKTKEQLQAEIVSLQAQLELASQSSERRHTELDRLREEIDFRKIEISMVEITRQKIVLMHWLLAGVVLIVFASVILGGADRLRNLFGWPVFAFALLVLVGYLAVIAILLNKSSKRKAKSSESGAQLDASVEQARNMRSSLVVIFKQIVPSGFHSLPRIEASR